MFAETRDFEKDIGQSLRVVGLIPAGGQATRISPLPCSKEIYPLGFRAAPSTHEIRPKVVSHYLLENMRVAGITECYIILRMGKWDIPAYYGDGTMLLGMNIAYLLMDLPYGAPYTLDKAYPFIQETIVALGFPDIVFKPQDAFVHLLTKQTQTDADIVLGLFPTSKPHKMDMVDLDGDGRVLGIDIKPARTSLRFTWIIAVWTPSFTRFMHKYVLADQTNRGCKNNPNSTNEQNELFVGHIIQAALKSDMQVESVIFSDGQCFDIGTPEEIQEVSGTHSDIWRSHQ